MLLMTEISDGTLMHLGDHLDCCNLFQWPHIYRLDKHLCPQRALALLLGIYVRSQVLTYDSQYQRNSSQCFNSYKLHHH
jgi:hypothetical protein